uniref:Uncharacterized protein n=1 Tax=Phaeomonas parva TaxID=124430 RepID=A0A7S1UFK9_9STRA|mmetsp:Transcript_45943/g.143780  ORF Transcript_45943/g.143780 Transcript_45943/m.143780 type:complete len:263 (+) Transcript_45943:167-955(+)|eukprot:CAMPEP_0118881380 /NCGR_PEP_ID=MMETSP1163-20130328/20873_1 /TAXON_ID=124430 /ORGANISM="Phaeomonas parva, Strain CCMP2877" /LENGTH=262 /DNA_ID=CAMNT_0006818149 /DNA_START=114 /DNA_END=902 /DNA_ORIENTATION=-
MELPFGLDAAALLAQAEALFARGMEQASAAGGYFTALEVRPDTKIAIGVGVALASAMLGGLALTGKPPPPRPPTAEDKAKAEAKKQADTEKAEKIMDHLRHGPNVRSARPEDNEHLPKHIKDVVRHVDWENFDEDAIVRKSKKAANRLGIPEAELCEAVRSAKDAMDRAARGELDVDDSGGGGGASWFWITDKAILCLVVGVGFYFANQEQNGALFRSLIRAFPKEARVLGFDVDEVIGIPVSNADVVDAEATAKIIAEEGA